MMAMSAAMFDARSADALSSALATLEIGERLKRIRSSLEGRIVFTTSFGIEDQFLTHWIAETGVDISLATLDTGRLFTETLDLWAATEERYGLSIASFVPATRAIENLMQDQGPLGFRQSVEARKACCHTRKVEPLGRALDGASGWITGLRGDRAGDGASLAFAQADAAHGLVKINPLLDFTRETIAAEAERIGIPVNALHAQGFLSIGCAPCTRALLPGEAERAGRWWWEDTEQRECGLHVGPDGRLSRAKPLETNS
jgi:phosphoadenosine phosphosulfate reductase